jgi:hypothetical protein
MCDKQRLAITAVLIAMLMSCAASPVYGSSITLSPPSGTISGAPGATVGWGFTISNASDFLVVTGSDFCVGADTSPCSNALGTYTDFIGPEFVVVGPPPESSTVSQPFDLTTQTGVGSFTFNSSALPGTNIAGEIVVTYDLFSVSPNSPGFDPITDTVSVGNQLSANATVRTAAVPEPATLILLACGLGFLPVLSHYRVIRRSSVIRK